MRNLLLLLAVVTLAVVPIYWHHGTGKVTENTAVAPSSTTSANTRDPADIFLGADSLAEDMIGKINPQYTPWFEPLWEPPSGEIENLLFVLQSVIGAGALFYVLGYIRGRNQERQGR
jgi:cobalt/nickel transport protein